MFEYSFEKLEVWKDAIGFVKKIYGITEGFPNDEKFGLTNQLRRASVSIAANLAEGSARITDKDKAHFTTMSYSSTMEVLNLIIISNELQYMPNETYDKLRKEISKITNKLNALRKSQLNKKRLNE